MLEVAARVQVLLMTCHGSTVELARQRVPHLALLSDDQGLSLFHAPPGA